MAETPPTDHFGLTRIGPGETLAKAGGAALDTDRVVLDALLARLLDHRHDADQAVADPLEPPIAVLSLTGGVLAADTTFHYSISWLDAGGMETAVSATDAVRTPVRIATPTAPVLTTANTGGTLGAGSWSYLITLVDASGGETLPSPAARILTTGSVSVVTLALPTAPPEATHWRVYRAGPDSATFAYLTQVTRGFTSVADNGLALDRTRRPPRVNTTAATSSVTVTAPTVPESANGWRIYRTATATDYSNPALIATVLRAGDGTLATDYVDRGDPVLRAPRRSASLTVSGGGPVEAANLTGSLTVEQLPALEFSHIGGTLAPEQLPAGTGGTGPASWSVSHAGPVGDGQVIARTRLLAQVAPRQITVFFGTPGEGDPVPPEVRVLIEDSAGTAVQVVTTAGQGYYVLDQADLAGVLFAAGDVTITTLFVT